MEEENTGVAGDEIATAAAAAEGCGLKTSMLEISTDAVVPPRDPADGHGRRVTVNFRDDPRSNRVMGVVGGPRTQGRRLS